MMKAFSRNLLAVISGVVGVVALVCLFLVVFGFRPFILQSESMTPSYTTGSLVWVNTHTALDEIEIGDVLVYRAPAGNLVMHRLVGKNKLQGDANDTVQEVKLDKTNYVGREAFSFPEIGDTVNIVLKHKWIVWSVVGVLIVLACIPARPPKKTS